MRGRVQGWEWRPLGSRSFLLITIIIIYRDRRAITLIIFNCTAKYILLNPKGYFKAQASAKTDAANVVRRLGGPIARLQYFVD